MTEIDNLWNLFDNVKKCNLENNKLDEINDPNTYTASYCSF